MLIPIGSSERGSVRRIPVVTYTIIAVNVGIFAYQWWLSQQSGGGEALKSLVETYGVIPTEISGPALIPWLLSPSLYTAMFMHSGWIHLAGNMLFLAPFGDNVEDRLGHLRFALLYVLAGLIATYAQIASHTESAIPVIGASGAVAAVMAAYLVFHPDGNVRAMLIVGPKVHMTTTPALFYIGAWFLAQIPAGLINLGVRTTQTAGVAHWAHFAGFVAGAILAILLRLTKRRR